MAEQMALDQTPPTPREEFRVTSSDGIQIAVEKHGVPGAPIVVMAHGWTCNTHFWAPMIRRLSTDHEIVVYDQRGHGRSERPKRTAIHSNALADDLSAVIAAAVPVKRRAVLVGHSLGAMTVVAFAARHHDQLRSSVAAVLLANTGVDELAGRLDLVPVPGGNKMPDNLARFVQFFVRGGLSDSLLLHALPPAVARQAVRHITMSPAATKEQTEFVTDIVLSCSRFTHHWVAQLLHGLDLSDEVQLLDVPTLVLVGELDRLTPPWHANRLAERLPASVGIIELPKMGHMTPIQAPDDVVEAVQTLVEDHLLGAATVRRGRTSRRGQAKLA